jgi:hypothetical protein
MNLLLTRQAVTKIKKGDLNLNFIPPVKTK